MLGSVLFFLFGLKFAMLGFACAAFATSYVFYQDHMNRNKPSKGVSRDAAGINDAISAEQPLEQEEVN